MEPTTERRVVLRGALAASAVLAAGCGSNADPTDVITSPTAAPGASSALPSTVPSLAPGATGPAAEPEIRNIEGFGAELRFDLADLADIEVGEPRYVPEGRLWLARYPAEGLEAAELVYSAAELAGMEAGFVALYQKCPHLGCRVPDCPVSDQFECPCHGSKYSPVGEKIGGPAPRGMDRFATAIDGDVLVIETGTIIQGPPIATNTIGWVLDEDGCVGAEPPVAE